MLSGGDELGRTQRGNNNAYCQDNEISWFEWRLDEAQQDFLAFCRYLLQLRREHPVFRRRHFFQRRGIRGAEVKDLTWFEPNGQEMTDQAWEASAVRTLMVRLGGDSIGEVDRRGERIADDTFLLLVNAHPHGVTFTLPTDHQELRWERILDTGDAHWGRSAAPRGSRYRLRGRSMAVLRAQRRSPRPPAGDEAGS